MHSQDLKKQAKGEKRSGGSNTAQNTELSLTPEQAVRKIMRCYNLNHIPNPSLMMENAAEALGKFPPEVLQRLSDPAEGILAKAKFPPTISELVSEAESYMKRISKNFV